MGGAVGPNQLQQVLALSRLEVWNQQVQDMVRTAQQRCLDRKSVV